MRTRTLSLSILYVITSISILDASPTKHLSGAEWLKDTANMYKQLHSLEGSSHLTESIRGGAILESDIDFLLMRPNMIKLDITNSQIGGGRVIVSNGKNLIIYNKSTNQYQIFPSQNSILQYLPTLQKQAHIGFSLDPIYFFIGEPSPGTLKIDPNVKHLIHNGIESTIVYATSIPQNTQKSKKQIAMHWQWIINSKTHMIEQIRAQSNSFQVKVPALLKSKKSVGLHYSTTSLTIQQDYLTTKANPVIPFNSFTANMRPGAKRIGNRK